MVRIYAEYIEVWYAQRRIEILPRLRGENGHCINYRHVIDWLVRKPGAFENYRYKDDLFPTSQFRITYDLLRNQYDPKRANKQYLKILELAAKDGETLVNDILRFLINQADEINFEIVLQMVTSRQQPPSITEVNVQAVDLTVYDRLLKFDVLMIDDFGYVKQGREEMEVLFTLLAYRYERGSMLITSNLPFSKWEVIFKDPMTTAAAIDRLVHHSVVMELNVPSYRADQARKRKNKGK